MGKQIDSYFKSISRLNEMKCRLNEMKAVDNPNTMCYTFLS